MLKVKHTFTASTQSWHGNKTTLPPPTTTTTRARTGALPINSKDDATQTPLDTNAVILQIETITTTKTTRVTQILQIQLWTIFILIINYPTIDYT
jgi:hypothetical protein